MSKYQTNYRGEAKLKIMINATQIVTNIKFWVGMLRTIDCLKHY